MSYASLALEWDETWNEMNQYRPEIGEDVLCRALEIREGRVNGILPRNDELFYRIVFNNGSSDIYAEEDVLKRKVAVTA